MSVQLLAESRSARRTRPRRCARREGEGSKNCHAQLLSNDEASMWITAMSESAAIFAHECVELRGLALVRDEGGRSLTPGSSDKVKLPQLVRHFSCSGYWTEPPKASAILAAWLQLQATADLLRRRENMKRFITSFAFALGCTALIANAQETKTKTEVKSSGGQPQVVSYTGCVQTGTQEDATCSTKWCP